MNKPLKDWTVGELKEYCHNDDTDCHGCLFWGEYNGAPNCVLMDAPCAWELKGPPRWTAEDIADAKAVKRLFPWATAVRRNAERDVYVEGDEAVYLIGSGVFPSLGLSGTVDLQEILDEEGKNNG